MGQVVGREAAREILAADNPKCRADLIAMYADAFADFHEAQSNIDAHGAIVAHPRTGQPMDNPYLKVKAAAGASLRKCGAVRNVARLWALAEQGG